MPYGLESAFKEHVANVSTRELRDLEDTFQDYFKKYFTSDFLYYSISEVTNSDKVIPRLLLDYYLDNQFEKYISIGKERGIKILVFKNTQVSVLVGIQQLSKF